MFLEREFWALEISTRLAFGFFFLSTLLKEASSDLKEGNNTILRDFNVSLQRLKAALTNQGTGAQDGAGGVAGSSIPAVPQRQEQSQQPSQNSDAPSPVQPQVP